MLNKCRRGGYMPVWWSVVRMFIPLAAGVAAFTLHSFTRAAASVALGDKTPANQGRLTVNPFKHIEGLGLLCLFFFGLGWDKPVETRPFAYRGNRRKGEFIVAVLPMVVNLLAASVFAAAAHALALAVPYETMILEGGLSGQRVAYEFLAAGAFVNLSFVIFNLIPIYPLDGARIIAAVKPNWWFKIQSRERILQMVLMLLLCFGILGLIISPLADGALSFFYR
jgi:Zn-dependent protease